MENFRTALGLQKTTSQQISSIYLKKREKLVAETAAVDVKSRRYRADMDTRPGRLQTSLYGKTRRTNEEEKERKRLFLSKKSVKAQLRHRSDARENVKVL